MTEQQQGEMLKEWGRQEALSRVIEDTSDKKSSSPQHLQHHPAVFYHTDVHSVRQADYGLSSLWEFHYGTLEFLRF